MYTVTIHIAPRGTIRHLNNNEPSASRVGNSLPTRFNAMLTSRFSFF